MNNNQILALVSFEHNGGQTASDNVISSYKINGNTSKMNTTKTLTVISGREKTAW